jgi:hypothetical protein
VIFWFLPVPLMSCVAAHCSALPDVPIKGQIDLDMPKNQ